VASYFTKSVAGSVSASSAVDCDLVSFQNPTAKGSKSGDIWRVLLLVVEMHDVFMNPDGFSQYTRSGYLTVDLSEASSGRLSVEAE
jgi:hypothetical protein